MHKSTKIPIAATASVVILVAVVVFLDTIKPEPNEAGIPKTQPTLSYEKVSRSSFIQKAKIMGKLAKENRLDELCSFANDPDTNVKMKLLHELAKVKDKAVARECIKKLLQDKDEKVSTYARECLRLFE